MGNEQYLVSKDQIRAMVHEVLKEDKELQEKSNGEMSEEETYRELIMPVDTNIRLSQVILSDTNKEAIRDFVMEMKNSGKLLKFGLKPMNRLLFYGASGCGKTILGKALCNHLGYTM